MQYVKHYIFHLTGKAKIEHNEIKPLQYNCTIATRVIHCSAPQTSLNTFGLLVILFINTPLHFNNMLNNAWDGSFFNTWALYDYPSEMNILTNLKSHAY